MTFKRVHIEISNICNVQCSFCPIVERPKDIMSLEEFEKILIQAVPLAEDICLHLMGEPLAHPQFLEIIALSKKHGASLQITTNGLLTKRYEDALLNSGVVRQLNFSLQAFKDNFPDRPLSEYLDPILDYTKKAFSLAPNQFINYRLWNHGTESFNLNEDVISYCENDLGFKLKRVVDPGGIKSKKVFKDHRLYFHFDSRFDWPNPHFPINSQRGTCQGLRNHIGIHADGTVVPCCLDKEAVINLGNVLEKPLIEILASSRAKAIKEGFERQQLVEDLCQRCTFINRFTKKKHQK